MKRIALLPLMLLLLSSFALAGSLPADIDLTVLDVVPGEPTWNGWQTGTHIVEISNSPDGEYDGEYAAFCVDPSFYVFYAVPYQLDNLPESYYPAAWVFENYKDYGASARDAQIAIWKLTIDPAADFENALQETLFADANDAVAEGYVAPGNLLLAYSPRGPMEEAYGEPYQDFIVDVPEPGSILLLGLGLLGVATISRLRRN